jgi:5-methylcytosine-specific restriction endonuclease McrA
MKDESVLLRGCNQCGGKYPLTTEFFYQYKVSGKFKYTCIECCRRLSREYSKSNREKINAQRREAKALNPDKYEERDHGYYIKHRTKRLEEQVEYRKNNKDKMAKYQSEWYKQNSARLAVRRKSAVLFSIYAVQLTIDEDPIEDEDGYLVAKCAYCGRYFYPTMSEVQHRIRCLLGKSQGENRLYCSDGCKQACPIFNQKEWPKGYQPASSREVDPLIRQMCLARDNYECQRCGVLITEAELHTHHIEGAVQQPMLAHDIENTITLCKNCHKWVHSQEGCTPYDLRCKK